MNYLDLKNMNMIFQVITDSRPKRPRLDDPTTVPPMTIDPVPQEMTSALPIKPSDEDMEIEITTIYSEPERIGEETTISSMSRFGGNEI